MYHIDRIDRSQEKFEFFQIERNQRVESLERRHLHIDRNLIEFKYERKAN
jgi:hypothetical protein